jgi:phytoene synthase
MAEDRGFPNAATPLGSSAYYSVRLSPAALHDSLALLLAVHKTLGDIAVEVSDPGVARLKLQWWREELQRSFAGNPQHPLTRELIPVIEASDLPREPFLQQAEQVESRIRGIRTADFSELERWLDLGQGALAELMARRHGVSDGPRIRQARRCGVFWGGVYLLRDRGADRRRGFDPLPRGAGPMSRWGEHLRSLEPAEAETANLPPAIAIRSRILGVLLREIADTGFDVEDQHIGLPPLRKLWVAWRTRGQSRFC